MYTFDDFVTITKNLNLSLLQRDRFPLQNDLDEENSHNCVHCGTEINSVFETGTCWYCDNNTCQDCFIAHAQDDNLINMIQCKSCEKPIGVSCAPLLVKQTAGEWALKSIGVEGTDFENEEQEKLQEIGIIFGIGKEIDEILKQISELSAAAAIDQVDFSKVKTTDEEGEEEGDELDFNELKKSAADFESSESLKNEKIELYTRVLKALNWIRDTFPSFFWGYFISNWFRAVAFRAQLENDQSLFENIKENAPDSFLDLDEAKEANSTLEDPIQHNLYPCSASLSPEIDSSIVMNHNQDIEYLMLSQEDIKSFNSSLENTTEHQDTAGGRADPMFDGLCGNSWKMRVWSVPSTEQHRHCINRVVDIRWSFSSNQHAAFYHGLRLAENSEGQKPVEKPLQIGQFCHVFGGTTVFQIQQQKVSLTLYVFIFRVENVVYKLLVSQGVQATESLTQEKAFDIAQMAASKK